MVDVATGRDRGKFLHVAPDGTAIVVDEPNAYTGFALDERSVLLKIHGHVDRNTTREWESFAVSEDDHIDYLIGADAAGSVPVQLAARLRRSHLLFLGYAVDDWSLRVFLRRVWGGDRLAYRSWAVQSAVEHVATELWRERGAEVYDVSLDGYARELTRLTAICRPRRRVNLPRSPFKGLAYFGESESDSLFFFGRERESELVAANLMASRLTVLYGPSGVGKTSLLRAGVGRRLRTLIPAGDSTGDGAAVVIVDRWRDDPVLTVAVAAGAATDIPLADALAERTITSGAELYLILDQMEEYVLYHGMDGGPLAGALEDVLTRPDLPVHVLFGVRDDSLADLDAFKRRLPGLFGNILRLDHLTRAAALIRDRGPVGVRTWSSAGLRCRRRTSSLRPCSTRSPPVGSSGISPAGGSSRKARGPVAWRRRICSSCWNGCGWSNASAARPSCGFRLSRSSAAPPGSSRSISNTRSRGSRTTTAISPLASSTTW